MLAVTRWFCRPHVPLWPLTVELQWSCQAPELQKQQTNNTAMTWQLSGLTEPYNNNSEENQPHYFSKNNILCCQNKTGKTVGRTVYRNFYLNRPITVFSREFCGRRSKDHSWESDSFSVLTLLIGWQQRKSVHKNHCHSSTKVPFWSKSRKHYCCYYYYTRLTASFPWQPG